MFYRFKASLQLLSLIVVSLPDKLYFVDFAPIRSETEGSY